YWRTEADMTTSTTYAPASSAIFPSIYGQPGFYGQSGYDQPGLSPFGITPQLGGQPALGQPPVGYGFPQLFGQQFGGRPQFGGPPPQFGGPQQQFGGPQQQFGGSEQFGIVVQLLPQLLWAAQQNLSAALHLVQQVVQQVSQTYGGSGFGEAPWARQA